MKLIALLILTLLILSGRLLLIGLFLLLLALRSR